MARLQKRNLSRPDEIRPVGRGQLEIVEIANVAIGRVTYQPGWRWSEDVRPIVGGEWCDLRHIGVVVSGGLQVEMADGTTLQLSPDDVFEIPPGHDAWVVGDAPWVAIDSVGRRQFGKVPDTSATRVLATIMFTDLVDSTATAAALGDRTWRDRLAEYRDVVNRALERFGGREVASTGDGVLATFDSPARAVRCATQLARDTVELGMEQRAGLHTGEVEVAGDDVRGIAVHLAARVAATSGASEVLLSSTTNQLLIGSGLVTVSRGLHELKGIDQPIELFVVDS